MSTNAKVAILMGSRSDWPVMEQASKILDSFGIEHECEVTSAHRTPMRMMKFAQDAADRGIQILIAGAGGAAHLPGMLAANTHLPVLGVPIATASSTLNGVDALLSIVQMPRGVPVPTLAIGNAGAVNAGLSAVSILALNDPALSDALKKYRQEQSDKVSNEKLR